MSDLNKVAERLAELYSESFGGKPSGRYRFPYKYLCELLERRRLYPEDIQALSRALVEKGFILIDMQSFYVVMSANSFTNYRRVGKSSPSH